MKSALLVLLLVMYSSLALDYCNVTLGADLLCDGIFPGTELDGKACNTTCQLTNESFNVNVTFRTCLTETLTDCLENQTITDLHIDYRVPLLVTFNVPLTPQLESNPPIVNVTVDGELKKSQETDSGYILFRYMSPGQHNLTILVSHPDYVDVNFSETIFVRPGLSGEVSVLLFPKEVTAQLGDSPKFNLTLNNSLNYPQNFSITSNLNATFQPSVSMNASMVKTIPVSIGPLMDKGSYTLNLTIASPDITLNAVSLITVGREEIYNATLALSQTEVGLKVLVTNTGTMWDEYNLSMCSGNITINLEPGDFRSFFIGSLDAPCNICLTSIHVNQCMSIAPISLNLVVPSSIDAELGRKTEIPFATNSTVNGTLLVQVDSPWIEDFTCTATCAKTLEFTPTHLGDFPITFHVSLVEYELEGSLVTTVHVIKGFSVSEDAEKINKKISQLENQLQLLESQDISSPATESIISQIKRAELKTPESVAEVLGQLERADKYIKYAREVRMPRERGLPLNQIVLGVSAILIGVGLLYVFQHYKSNPYHPVYQRLGLSPKDEDYEGSEKFIKNEFKGSRLPPLR